MGRIPAHPIFPVINTGPDLIANRLEACQRTLFSGEHRCDHKATGLSGFAVRRRCTSHGAAPLAKRRRQMYLTVFNFTEDTIGVKSKILTVRQSKIPDFQSPGFEPLRSPASLCRSACTGCRHIRGGENRRRLPSRVSHWASRDGWNAGESERLGFQRSRLCRNTRT